MITGNEPAFNYIGNDMGLTMRQYYAGLAMQGLLANKCILQFYQDSERVTVSKLPPEFVAERSIEYASALIDELNRQK